MEAEMTSSTPCLICSQGDTCRKASLDLEDAKCNLGSEIEANLTRNGEEHLVMKHFKT